MMTEMKNMRNAFIDANVFGEGTSFTENGAVSYASIGSALLDQFAKAGTARGRDIDIVWNEQATLWGEDSESALRFPFYLRMITRKDNFYDGEATETVQRGQGARDEAFKRLLWIAKYHPEEFYRNLYLLPIVGSWKDLWQLMVMDESLDREKFYNIIAAGINSESHKDLVKKYLPRIRAVSKCKTEWAQKTNAYAKEFANFAGWTFEEYRSFKTTGKAHKFQTVICSGLYDEINWKTIPGKALLNLVSGNFLKKHKLEGKYVEWLKTQPVAKFNGYPFELGQKVGYYSAPLSLAQKITIDKQFEGLLQTGRSDNGGIKGNVLCALDTSGSMSCPVQGGPYGLTSYDVCVSLGVYFSALNEGAFHNVVAMFDNTSSLLELKGDSFVDKLNQIKSERTAWGGTNFQSLINLICRTRVQRPEIPESEFPHTLLVVSDIQFNNCGERSNYETAKAQLRQCFSEEFVNDFTFIWWYCAGRATYDYASNKDCAGVYNISGFDGSVISFICGGEEKVNPETGEKVKPTQEEVVQAALTQEVLMLVK